MFTWESMIIKAKKKRFDSVIRIDPINEQTAFAVCFFVNFFSPSDLDCDILLRAMAGTGGA